MEFSDSDSVNSTLSDRKYDSDDAYANRVSSRSKNPLVIENFFQKTRNRKARCSSRNAIIARENRLKKKEYLRNVESEIVLLRKENEILKDKLNKKSSCLKSMKREVTYLKSVITNKTSIKTLLSGLNEVLQNRNGRNNFIENSTLSNPSWYPQLNDTYSDPLLSSFNETDGISFPDPVDHQLFNQSADNIDDESLLPQVGICLHINNKKISMELCSQCNLSSEEITFH